MAAGLPVVCFDRKNNREYLEEGAVYSREISSEGLSRAIIELAGNYDEIRRRGGINLERSKKLSWDNSADKIERVYRSISKK
jgi:glycosyltransferase involved in cell wall biosynthesis